MGNKIMINNKSSANDLDILDVVKVMLNKFKTENNVLKDTLSAKFTLFGEKRIIVKILFEESKFKSFMIDIIDEEL